MEWLDRIRGSAVGVDTAPLIYFIEKHSRYLPVVFPFFEAMERGEIQGITSSLTFTEVMVHPLRRGDEPLARQYSRILLHARNLTTVPVSPEIAMEAARIRAATGIKVPDAIHIATAIVGGAKSFLTNDSHLAPIDGLELLVVDRLANAP